jgi:hypothetical protein
MIYDVDHYCLAGSHLNDNCGSYQTVWIEDYIKCKESGMLLSRVIQIASSVMLSLRVQLKFLLDVIQHGLTPRNRTAADMDVKIKS